MKAIVLLGLLAISLSTFSQNPGDHILGTYWTEEKTGKISIEREGDSYKGRIIWREDARKDINNPDPSLRSRKVVGITFLHDFRYQPKEDIWTGGTVYAIDNGGTYSGKLWLENNGQTLKMRGYWGISLLGRTATLTRIE